ncbi:MAG: hypothetical protein ACI31O_01030 [Limosilactobacillus vaginalis]
MRGFTDEIDKSISGSLQRFGNVAAKHPTHQKTSNTNFDVAGFAV